VGDAAPGPARAARPLEHLTPSDLDSGCVGSTPTEGLPHYALEETERDSLRTLLEQLPALRSPAAPLDRLAITLKRLRCTACHAFHGQRGPEPGIVRYFRSDDEADLGDEGRLPPSLSNVGAKLNRPWLVAVLAGDARARPHLATRMPRFGGENVADLPTQLVAAAGVIAEVDDGPVCDQTSAAAGRDLVGATAMNCIQCHAIAGRPSTGTAGPDLVQMVERLRFGAFAPWLHDPSRLRPGTRMPSFFVLGRSAFTEHFEGRAADQVRAIWCYLSQGAMLPLPEGLADPAGLVLDVASDPMVLRTFMEASGVRSIACGFPEQVHCVFDAEGCRLAAVWTGQFLNAQGAWAARGGSPTDPPALVWEAPPGPIFRVPGQPPPPEHRFGGYRLDERRRPVFLYRILTPAGEVEVTEQPFPRRCESIWGLVRRIELTGAAGLRLEVVHPGLPLRPGLGAIRSLDAARSEVQLDGRGRASFELEVTVE
jgi:cytochrome c553